jgi:hypothetical protein
MPAAFSGAREGLAIGLGVVALAGFFAWRQWVETRTRDNELSVDDARYFKHKDIRRSLGTSVLGLIGIGMIVGSLINPKIQKMPFLWVWLIVGVLVLLSILLALVDWFANFAYAARHRRLLIEERLKLIENEYKNRAAAKNGHGGSSAV